MTTFYKFLFVSALLTGSALLADDQPPISPTKPSEADVKEYRAIMAEYQSVQTTWKDAPKKERDEALKAWQETNAEKLHVLRQKVLYNGPSLRESFANRPIPENTPPGQKAYLEEVQKYHQLLVQTASSQTTDPATKKLLEEQKAKLTELAEVAKKEREEIESKLPEPERKKLELRRAQFEEDKAARDEFFKSLKKMAPDERSAALKKWHEQHSLSKLP